MHASIDAYTVHKDILDLGKSLCTISHEVESIETMVESLTNQMMNLMTMAVSLCDYFQESKLANIVNGSKPITTT